MRLIRPLALLAAGVIVIVAAALGVGALRPLVLASPPAPDTVGSEPYPWGVAVNPATNRVYVANMGSGTVAVVDGAVDRVVATIPVGLHPAQLAVNPETNRVYVANRRSASVSVVDGAADRVVATIPVGELP